MFIPTTIAIIFDCDDTLASDTTVWLLKELGIDSDKFWKITSGKVINGWDPCLAYMHSMLEDEELSKLTKDSLIERGKAIKFYPGIPEFFKNLSNEIIKNSEYKDYNIMLEFYLLTSGIEDMIRESCVAPYMKEIWGSNFYYDDEGKIAHPKAVVSFTEKTRFIFNINKDCVGKRYRQNPYYVNSPSSSDDRPIPFKNMIYIGDGPSDIPCMSLIEKNKGYVIGILSDHSPEKTYALGFGRRAHITIPPDYSKGIVGYKQIVQATKSIADNIIKEYHYREPVIPKY